MSEEIPSHAAVPQSLDIDVNRLRPEELVQTLGAVETLRAKILGRIISPISAVAPEPRSRRGPALTVKQTAEKVGVSEAWVWRAVKDGRLPHFKIGTRNIRIPDSAIAKLEKGGAA